MSRIRIKNLLGISVFLLLSVMIVGCSDSNKNDLEAIQERGKLIVGTSADYPPYEYVEDGEYVGFDMEIINEVASRMDLEVEIVDMGFDTLIASLKQGKVDAVIASMSASPDRREGADFTEAYYKNIQAFITRKDSNVEINEATDLQNYTVGLQTGTSHETWVIENLVDEGLMLEEDLFRYEKTDMGILDLDSNRIDVFITELPVAKANLKIYDNLQISFEYDVNPVYGGPRIAVQKGNSELLSELNNKLLEILDEGLIEEFEQKWLTGTE